jgi:hypothetical protein
MRKQKTWRATAVAAIVLVGLSFGGKQVRAADLTQYISPDFCAVLVIHPERIGESPLANDVKSALLKEMGAGDPVSAALAALKKQPNPPPGFDSEKLVKLLHSATIHRVVIVWDVQKENKAAGASDDRPDGIGMIVQFNDDVDGDGILSAVRSDWQGAEVGGVKYKKWFNQEKADRSIAALSPDSRTLIAGFEPTVLKMLAKNDGERPLLNQLKKASLNHDVLLEFSAESFWTGMTKSTGKTIDELLPPMNNPAVANIAKDLKSISLQLDFSGKTLLHGEVACGKAETAASMAAMGNMGMGVAKQQFAAAKQPTPPGEKPPALANLLTDLPALSKVSDEIFAGLTIKSEGSQLTVELSAPDSLPEVLKAVVKMFSQRAPAAAPAPAGP